MITANTFIFLAGGFTFLIAFSYFKDAAIEVFKKELSTNNNHKSVWYKLFKVFLVDWLVCVLGVLITGILFVALFSYAH